MPVTRANGEKFMKRFLKTAVLRLADRVPNPIYRILVPRPLVGFFYHLVARQAVPHVQYLYPHRPAEVFEQDLVYVKEKFHVLSYEELAAALASRKRLPRRAAFLSFDDGFSECFTEARPLLLKHDLPCTFFVATDLVDNRRLDYLHQVSLCIEAVGSLGPDKLAQILSALGEAFQVKLDSLSAFIRWIRKVDNSEYVTKICDMLGIDIANYLRTRKPYLSRAQIRTMAAEGFTIGAHGLSHRKLGRLAPAEIEREIVHSCQAIHELTDMAPVPFAFPNSAMGIERGFLRSLRRRTPLLGLLFDTKDLSRDEDFIVNRIWVESPKLNPTGRVPLPLILRRACQSQLGLPPAVMPQNKK
jgi:peptidoglycan/xylan/chitin deacetylase (PgdA/CDA1 family)